jgi:phage regulator Rha-like protein
MSNLKRLFDDFQMVVKSMDPMSIQFTSEFIKEFDDLTNVDKLIFSVSVADTISSKELMGKDAFREKQGMKILIDRFSTKTKNYIRSNIKGVEYPIIIK